MGYDPTKVRIDNCQDFLAKYDAVRVCGTRYEIHTANRHGDMRVGPDAIEVNIADDDVELIEAGG